MIDYIQRQSLRTRLSYVLAIALGVFFACGRHDSPQILAQEEAPFHATKEHRLLKQFVGKWKVQIEGSAQLVNGFATCDMCGEYWLLCNIEYEGVQIQEIVGYDPREQSYYGFKCSNMSPYWVIKKGSFDQDSQTLTFSEKRSVVPTGEKVASVQKWVISGLDAIECITEFDDGTGDKTESSVRMAFRRVKEEIDHKVESREDRTSYLESALALQSENPIPDTPKSKSAEFISLSQHESARFTGKWEIVSELFNGTFSLLAESGQYIRITDGSMIQVPMGVQGIRTEYLDRDADEVRWLERLNNGMIGELRSRNSGKVVGSFRLEVLGDRALLRIDKPADSMSEGFDFTDTRFSASLGMCRVLSLKRIKQADD